jgi:hypothetical protein
MSSVTRSLVLALAGLALGVSLPSQSITTLFSGGNSGTTTWTNQFDLMVHNPAGITLIGVEVNCENTRSAGVGSPFVLNVWRTALGGTHVGNETNPAAWTAVTTGQGISRVMGAPTPVDLDDLWLAPGSYGIAFEYLGTAMAYTNGNGVNQTYSNADLTLTLGSSTTGRFGLPMYTPRVWNGTLQYLNGSARWWPFGEGCPGSAGTPTIAPAAGSGPQLGTNFTLGLGNLPAAGTPVVVMVGVSRTLWGTTPLPFDLAAIGAPNCALAVSIDATATLVSTSTVGSFSIFVPPIPSLAGAALHWQGAVVDPAWNQLGIVLTAAGTSYLGT